MFAADDASDETAGALAIDSNQGPAWGWAAGHATIGEARQRALDECGSGCHVVVTFEEGCGAYAADQTLGSTVSGWAFELDTDVQAREAALDYCAGRGGRECIVRAWACGDGFGGGHAGASRGGKDPSAAADSFGDDMDGDSAGALAIYWGYGVLGWGWASGYATVAEAERVALEECDAEHCNIAMSFEEGCAAFAADRTIGSRAYGWAAELDTKRQATEAALEECRKGDGSDCVVLSRNCDGDDREVRREGGVGPPRE